MVAWASAERGVTCFVSPHGEGPGEENEPSPPPEALFASGGVQHYTGFVIDRDRDSVFTALDVPLTCG